MVGLDLRYGAESRGAEEAAREEDGEVEEGAIAIGSTSVKRVKDSNRSAFRFCFGLESQRLAWLSIAAGVFGLGQRRYQGLEARGEKEFVCRHHLYISMACQRQYLGNMQKLELAVG